MVNYSMGRIIAEDLVKGFHENVSQRARIGALLEKKARADSEIYAEVLRLFERRGTILVAAAGNDCLPVLSQPLAHCRTPIVVGACTPEDSIATFSNYGSEVDVCAPGQDVWSCSPDPASPIPHHVGNEHGRSPRDGRGGPHEGRR